MTEPYQPDLFGSDDQAVLARIRWLADHWRGITGHTGHAWYGAVLACALDSHQALVDICPAITEEAIP